MKLTQLDWIVVCLYITVTLVTGLYFARRASRQTDEFFLGGRSMPWWLLGTSMVATTFSTDTPNLVTDLVRTGGVSENWIWWAMGISGMCTVFFYAQLWRRSNILTDVGFYELRYSGRPAAFLRGFRALYLGIFFNVMIMATVTLAAIKIGGVLLGVSKYEVILIAGTVTALYSATSGFWGVVVTDLLLFIVAMTGSLAAAYYAVQQPAVGGLNGLFTNPALEGKLALLPDFTDLHSAAAIFIIPIAVQWWSTWYPGAEPGGGGYIAQRMLAAKDESHALKATLWFNLAHYALRPWPWIIVALASLIVYPTLDSIQAAFPTVDPSIVRHDLAYPAMLVFLPSGLLGLVVASLAAAYMSTISTHLNWGASYIIDDWYRRFISPNREDRHYLRLARLATIGLIIFAGIVSLWLENALQAFQILLQIGAGTGLVFLLRWFWWRINAWSEISAMIISFLIAVYFQFVHTNILGLEPLEPSFQLVLGVLLTSIGWVTVTLLTPPASPETLKNFHQLIRPMGGGWRGAGLGLEPEPNGSSPTAAFLAWFLGCIAIYGALFGTGYALYGRNTLSLLCITIAALAILWLFRLLPKIDLR